MNRLFLLTFLAGTAILGLMVSGARRATAVGLGRPYAYGLAVDGERGVWEVVANVLAEFDLTLGLAGRTSVGEIGPAALSK